MPMWNIAEFKKKGSWSSDQFSEHFILFSGKITSYHDWEIKGTKSGRREQITGVDIHLLNKSK